MKPTEDRIHRESAQGNVRDTGAGVNDSAAVRQQYGTADRLMTRISIHSRYSVNRQGFGNWIASHYRIREGMSVLELGCGTGDMWAGKDEIIRRCSRFVLSDFSEGMLDKAKETLRDCDGIEYRAVDIQDIPFDDHTFDIVIANMMLYHVPDLPRALREVARVMKEDGTFCCATYGEHGMMAYICSLFGDYHIRNHVSNSFTLQNGEEKLKTVFPVVRKFLYEDALEVTSADDMADYIRSLTGMTDLQRIPDAEVRAVLERNMRDGILHVPKEYGMFTARFTAHEDDIKETEIFGANRFDTFTRTRAGSRAVIVRDGMILLSHETVSGWWLVPGGGLEEGETPEACCVRETEEETGLIVRPLRQFLTLYEYYEEYRYISHYFICEVTGKGQMRLTDAEKRRGLEPRWLPLREAVDLFSRHQSYAAVSEEKRGSYLREYTALQEYLKSGT